MDVSKKIFINSAWTAAGKVPKKSARGVDLVYGENAFATISAAKSKLGSLDGYGLYVADRSVKLTTVGDLKMVSAVEPICVESFKDNGSGTISDAMQVKLAAANEITIKSNTDDTLLVQGYKTATIDGIKDGNAAQFVVVGGNNVAATTFAQVDKSGNIARKWTRAYTANAAGDLDVKNADALTIEGLLFDWSDDTVYWPSKSSEADITPGPYYPLVERGYANVKLTNVQNVADFNGGSLKFSFARNYTEDTIGNTADTRKESYISNPSGKLSVGSGSVITGTVSGYSDVTIIEDSDFSVIYGAADSVSQESSTAHTVKGDVTADTTATKYSQTRRASGKATITDVTNSVNNEGSIRGYATVTVTDSVLNAVGTVDAASAGNYTYSEATSYQHTTATSTEVIKNASKDTETTAQNGTFTANGTDPSNPVIINGEINGFNRVALKNVNVAGTIAAAYEGGDANNAPTRAYTETNVTSYAYNLAANGDESEVTEDKYSRVENSTGSVALTSGWIAGNIIGYSNVTVKGDDTNPATLDGAWAQAGNRRYEAGSSYKRNTRSVGETIVDALTTRETDTAVGTFAATDTVITNNMSIEEFQTVTLNDVDGTIQGAVGGNTDRLAKLQDTSVNGIASIKHTRALNTSATGAFTAKNTSGSMLAVDEDIYGFNKVQISNTDYGTTQNTVAGSIISDNYSSSYGIEAQNLEDDSWIVTRLTTIEDGADWAVGVESRSTARRLNGTVTLDNTVVQGDVNGYSTITLSNGAQVTNVNFFDFDGDGFNDPLLVKETQKYQKNVESHYVSSSTSATAALTLKAINDYGDINVVNGNVYNVNKLALDEAAIVGGSAEMLNSNYVAEEQAAHSSKGDSYARKIADSRSAVGTVTVKRDALLQGPVYGAKSVSVTSGAIIGDLLAGFTFSSNFQEKGVSKEGDILTIAGGIADPMVLTQYEMASKETRSAVAGVTMTEATAPAMNIEGYSKVALFRTDIDGDHIDAGKYSENNNRKYTNVERNGRIIRTDATSRAVSDTALGSMTVTSGAVTTAVRVSGFQSVSFTDVAGDTDEILGGNLIQNTVNSRWSVDDGGDLKAYKTVDTTSHTATGSFAATVTSGGAALGFAQVGGFMTAGGGFTNVKVTSANVYGDVQTVTDVDKTNITYDAVSLKTTEFSHTSKYTGSASFSTTVGDGDNYVGGNINGFTTVVLDGTLVGGGINRWVGGDTPDYYEWLVTKDVQATKWNSEKPLVTFSSSRNWSTTATASLTLKNGAIIATGIANNVNKLTVDSKSKVTSANDDSVVRMFNSSVVGSGTVTLKGDDFTAMLKGSATRVANGTVTITGANGDMPEVGNLEGVKSLTAISGALIGYIEGWNREQALQRDGAKVTLTTHNDVDGVVIVDDFSGGESGSLKETDVRTAKGSVALTDVNQAGSIEGAATVKLAGVAQLGDSGINPVAADAFTYKNTAQHSWTQPDAAHYRAVEDMVQSAVGSFTATSTTYMGGTYIDGDVQGFATVGIDGMTYLAGSAIGGNTIAKGSFANGSGTYVVSQIVTGSFSAAEDSYVTDDIIGFATVDLEDAFVGGGVTAGNWTTKFAWDASQWYYLGGVVEATDVVATGALTVDDSIINGGVYDFKTATFQGENEVGFIQGVATTTVKDGATLLTATTGIVGRDIDETVNIEGAAVLRVTQDMDFGEGNDAINVAGTLALIDDSAKAIGLEKLAGNGLVAVQDSFDIAAFKDSINAVDAALTFVKAGNDKAVRSIRGKEQELGDNAAASANAIAVEDVENTGWLCAKSAAGFVDKVDWYSFSVKDGIYADFAFKIEYADDASAYKGTLYKAGTSTTVDVTDGWSDTLADGNYQLKLELTGTTAGPLAYTLKRS